MKLNPQYKIREDLLLIASMVDEKSSVLDIGCGDGDLLYFLQHKKGVDGRGIELSMDGVNACVSHGLAVIQGDADTDLLYYPAEAFDYVILSQTLQATRAPKQVLENLLRIGKHVIVSFPNFGYWRVRASLSLKGRMPRTKSLPHNWYDTPNIHFCTIKDFVELCKDLQITIDRSLVINHNGISSGIDKHNFITNLFGEQAIFLLKR
ncbi:MAG: methionine biosynthesis protein MetW [Pseudomonadota bacterium]|nr:methionine biosynthesis protein MetW [Pseudomonadota bacterium]